MVCTSMPHHAQADSSCGSYNIIRVCMPASISISQGHTSSMTTRAGKCASYLGLVAYQQGEGLSKSGTASHSTLLYAQMPHT